MSVRHRGQFHQPDIVLKRRQLAAACLKRQPCFPDPAGPGQRHRTVGGEKVHLSLASARQRDR